MTIDELTELASKELCKLFKQDPESPVAVPSEIAGANKEVPLWHTVTPQIREFLLMNEAVKAAIRVSQAPLMPVPGVTKEQIKELAQTGSEVPQ